MANEGHIWNSYLNYYQTARSRFIRRVSVSYLCCELTLRLYSRFCPLLNFMSLRAVRLRKRWKRCLKSMVHANLDDRPMAISYG